MGCGWPGRAWATWPEGDRALMLTDRVDWTREGLAATGFDGFVPLADLPFAPVPRGSGVYVVFRDRVDEPTFLEVSPAGRFKAKEPTVDVSSLERAWVPEAQVLYIGKAAAGATGREALPSGSICFVDTAPAHLSATGAEGTSGNLKTAASWVAWRETPNADAEAAESELIDRFLADWGPVRSPTERPDGRFSRGDYRWRDSGHGTRGSRVLAG